MLDQLARLNEEQLVFLGLMGGMVLIAATILACVIAVQIRKMRQRELDLGFKDDLLLRGYSVDETIRLVTSRKPGWSQGLIALGDWLDGKFRPVARRLTDMIRRSATDGGRLAGDLWYRVSPHVKQFPARTAPWFRSTVSHLNSSAHWLSDQTESLARRLVTPRP